MTIKGGTPDNRANQTDVSSVLPYSEFVRQLELKGIWLAEAHISNQYGPDEPGQGQISVTSSAACHDLQGGFRVLHAYCLTFTTDNSTALEIRVTFGVDYCCPIAPSADIFSTFERSSLALNTWPYLREFVANSMARLAWRSFTLPAFKIDAGSLIGR